VADPHAVGVLTAVMNPIDAPANAIAHRRYAFPDPALDDPIRQRYRPSSTSPAIGTVRTLSAARADGSLATVSQLTERLAFLAMVQFLRQYAERAGDDLITLLGDVESMGDGQPTDPAAWSDWLACVEEVTQRPEA